MAPKFFGREIEVTVSGEVKVPVSFRIDQRQYEIAEIIAAWPDHEFGRAPLRRKRWWQRHHRNYYRVKATSDEVFEIYHDRGTRLEQARKGKWYLHRQV
ncbi:MAG: hypothetical protein HY670_04410 [Chloroflexi bacterium]|nr:hypothetical protein [Chloroflexota bacterium]